MSVADVTRKVYTPITDATKAPLNNWKEGVNEQIDHMNKVLAKQNDPEIIRMIKLGITNVEQGSMWFVKGITSQGFNDNKD